MCYNAFLVLFLAVGKKTEFCDIIFKTDEIFISFFVLFNRGSLERSDKMNDASIIELYWERNQQAIRETDKKYGRLCLSTANNLLNNLHDSQECVNDTYLVAWNKIPPTKPEHLAAFLCRITKNIAYKKIERNNALKRSNNLLLSFDELGDCVSGISSPEDEIYLKELSDAISTFLYKQKERDQAIFLKRYWFCNSISDIASEVGLSEKNTTLILFRLRQKLKNYLMKEGFDI